MFDSRPYMYISTAQISANRYRIRIGAQKDRRADVALHVSYDQGRREAYKGLRTHIEYYTMPVCRSTAIKLEDLRNLKRCPAPADAQSIECIFETCIVR